MAPVVLRIRWSARAIDAAHWLPPPRPRPSLVAPLPTEVFGTVHEGHSQPAIESAGHRKGGAGGRRGGLRSRRPRPPRWPLGSVQLQPERESACGRSERLGQEPASPAPRRGCRARAEARSGVPGPGPGGRAGEWRIPGCSSTGAPRSMLTRAFTRGSIRSRGALIQPRRSPPQWDFDALPTVIAVWSWAAYGSGISGCHRGPARRSSRRTGMRCAPPTVPQQSSSGPLSPISKPVGLWKSGMSSAMVGRAERAAAARASRSQPWVPRARRRHPGRGPANGGQGVRINRRLGDHPIARVQQGSSDDLDASDRAAGDDHLTACVGSPRAAQPAVAISSRSSGSPSARAVPARRSGRQAPWRLRRLGHPAEARVAAQVRSMTPGMLSTGKSPPRAARVREGGAGTASPRRHGEVRYPVSRKGGIRVGHGRPAHPERRCETALAGQPGARGGADCLR